MNRLFAASFAVLAGIGSLAASPASAETMKVEFRDLDLFAGKDRAKLDRRIDAAVKKVCGYNEVRTGTRIRTAENQCYREAKAGADAHLARIMSKERLGG